MSSANPVRFPGDLLLLPTSLIALALLVANDDIFKHRFHDWLTGKASDAAGIVFFPLLVTALIETVRFVLRRRPWALSRRSVTACVVVVVVGFALMKTWTPADQLFEHATSALRWPVAAIRAAATGKHIPGLARVHEIRDPTDLIVLPLAFLPWWSATRLDRRASGDEPLRSAV
jgi:uncharacterized membrane protein YhaH (DUF805 family)